MALHAYWERSNRKSMGSGLYMSRKYERQATWSVSSSEDYSSGH